MSLSHIKTALLLWKMDILTRLDLFAIHRTFAVCCYGVTNREIPCRFIRHFPDEPVENADFLPERLISMRGFHRSIRVLFGTYLNAFHEGQQGVPIQFLDVGGFLG